MDSATTAFLSGQYEGIWLVLEALYDVENSSKEGEISREWITKKLNDLMLNDFTDRILNTYLPYQIKKKK